MANCSFSSRSKSSVSSTIRTGSFGSGSPIAQTETPSFYFYDLNSKATYAQTDRDIFSLSLYAGRDKLDESLLGQTGPGGQAPDTLDFTDLTEWGNRGTSARGKTDVGADCLIMAYAHVAHDCRIGNHVIMGGQAGVGDHSVVEDGAIIGGGCGVLPRKTLRGGGRVYWGYPAVPLDKAKRQAGEIALLGKLRERVKALEKRVKELS